MDRVEKKTIVCVIGTRPEAIKMAPLILALRKTAWARCLVFLTGQHRELVDQVLAFFGVTPDVDLDVMRKNVPFDRLAAHLIGAISDLLVEERPDLVLAQGDTTTVVATAMACAERYYIRACRGRSAHGESFRPISRRGQSRYRDPPRPDPFRSNTIGACQPHSRGDRPAIDFRDRQHGHRCAPVGRGARFTCRCRARSAQTPRVDHSPPA